MADKKTGKKILYEKFKEENMAAREQEAIGRQYGIEAEKIIVRKESGTAKVIAVVTETAKIVIKIIGCAIIVALVSFALTVLINTQLREAVFEVMKTW